MVWSWSVLLVGWLISTLVKITVLSRNNLVWISGLRLLKHHFHDVKSNPSIQYLSSIRSLIINPYTSKNIISAVFETLTLCLHQLPQQEQTLENQFQYQNQNHYLKLICDSNKSSSVNSQFKVESLSVLLTIAEHDGNLVYATIDYDENVIIELCFDSSVSVRYWILKNVLRFGFRDEILVGVLLGFINDPYTYVRKIALNGLVRLRKSVMEFKNGGLTTEGYNRAVDLFVGRNDCVRAAEIRVVCEWWQMLLDSSIEVGEHDWFDSVFVQLCSMVRDMSMEVRNEVFVSLREIKMFSEDILLQTFSKKVLGYLKERKFPRKSNTKIYDLHASNATGAFVHGLEDEFYEVRRSSCNSLGMLISFYFRFENDALNLLMDMLNDHSMVVRLQILEIMYHMETSGRLKVQEAYMHMFLGTLEDTSTLIRRADKKFLGLLKLPFMKIFKSSINGILTNLETYPEDEADIFSILFYLDSNHESFAVSFVTEVSQEIEPSSEGELRFDNPRVAAILVLVISSPLTHERLTCSIPAKFSVADVESSLGSESACLENDCTFSSNNDEQVWNQVCINCMKCWEDMKGSSIHSGEVETTESHVCRFVVLVSLTSKRIDDRRWALLVYRCLGSLEEYSHNNMGCIRRSFLCCNTDSCRSMYDVENTDLQTEHVTRESWYVPINSKNNFICKF
ncbi:hypothetical protein MKX01_030962 [Papaver californicum]|nr:hypothetical protein MKX01_030962 [Papaver californicum]